MDQADTPHDRAPAGTSPALLDALWAVVARHGWHGTTFARVAAASGEPLSDLRARYATPVDLLRAHARAVDRFVLEGTIPDPDGLTPPRDLLFDLLMRRFDALAPHREGVLRLQRDLLRDPISALALSPILLASMAWTLEGAGVPTGGPAGLLRVHGLAGVWITVSRTWAEDDTADLGATMAALDRALDRAEKVARTLRLDAGRPEPAEAPVSGAAPHGTPEPPYGGPSDAIPGFTTARVVTPGATLASADDAATGGRFPDPPEAVPAVPPGAASDDLLPLPDNPPDALGPESPGEGPDTATRPDPGSGAGSGAGSVA